MAEPCRHKVLYGGRDGIKSWSFAMQLVLNGASRPIRWLCCREVQKSIEESVHKLLGDTIKRLHLDGHYRLTRDSITGKNGTEIFFSGLRNAKDIKSYESCDGVWVEEAQNVSKASWDILLPTIRKEGSEVWVSFNPELATDETYKRWVLNPPPNTRCLKTNWRDNKWLTEVSRVAIEHMQATSPKDFSHIYEGECRSDVEGAIFSKEIAAAVEAGRLTSVPYNRAKPVITAWDLGFGDLTAIWFLQAYDGWYNFIDYLQGSGETIADYLVKLQERKYVYSIDWLPHDGIDTIIHHRLAGGDRSMSVEQLLRQAGRNVRIVPKLYVTDRINAARTIFSQCRFDQDKCADGIQALRHYQWGPLTTQGIPRREPLHDWASHAADGFCAAAVAVKQPAAAVKKKEAPGVPPVWRGEDNYAPFG